MSKVKYFIPDKGTIQLIKEPISNKGHFLTQGGEGDIYKYGNYIVKVFLDGKHVLTPEKFNDLSKIQSANVVKPLALLKTDEYGKVVGFLSNYIDNVDQLSLYFTKDFKISNSLSNQDILDLVINMQKTVKSIHQAGCQIVDLNEYNILVSKKDKRTPYFIDTNSYQTPTSKATALMESVKDHTIQNNNYNEMSDWYSFGILIFQLFTNLHPYKGRHPNYKINELSKRMKEGVSVLDSKSTIPKNVESFSTIPTEYMDWFVELFKNNKRVLPPDEDTIVLPKKYYYCKNVQNNDQNAIENKNAIGSMVNYKTVTPNFNNKVVENISEGKILQYVNLMRVGFTVVNKNSSNYVYSNNVELFVSSNELKLMYTSNESLVLAEKIDSMIQLYLYNSGVFTKWQTVTLDSFISKIPLTDIITGSSVINNYLSEGSILENKVLIYDSLLNKVFLKSNNVNVYDKVKYFGNTVITSTPKGRTLAYFNIGSNLYYVELKDIEYSDVCKVKLLNLSKVDESVLLLNTVDSKGVEQRYVYQLKLENNSVMISHRTVENFKGNDIDATILDKGSYGLILYNTGKVLEIFADFNKVNLVETYPIENLQITPNGCYYVKDNHVIQTSLS